MCKDVRSFYSGFKNRLSKFKVLEYTHVCRAYSGGEALISRHLSVAYLRTHSPLPSTKVVIEEVRPQGNHS